MIEPGALTPLTPLRPRLHPAVALTAAGAGVSSGLALALSIATRRPLWLWSSFVFAPGLVALVALSTAVRREQQHLFVARLRRGAAAGALATGAYDVSRWAVEATGLAGTNSFLAIPAFGAGLTGLPPAHAGAQAAGWAFHACNGVGFALAYTFLAAGRHWSWAILYALALEAAMVGLYPGWLGITPGTEFLSVSILGHVAYGGVLGVLVRGSP